MKAHASASSIRVACMLGLRDVQVLRSSAARLLSCLCLLVCHSCDSGMGADALKGTLLTQSADRAALQSITRTGR